LKPLDFDLPAGLFSTKLGRLVVEANDINASIY
jgi:hypothetical protein